MAAFQKSRMLLMVLAISLPGSLLAGLENSVENHEISLNYLNKEIIKAVISVLCFEQSNSCQSTLEFEQDGDYQSVVTPASLRGMKFQGHFQRDLNDSSEFGAVAVKKDSRETKIPLSIDYDKLSLGDYDNPITRAVIAQLHPSLIYHASTELEQITKISDYLIGETKNSETLHLFKPERHKLSDKDFKKLVSSINAEFMTLDIGESYSMVIVFNHKKIPESIHVLDRWKLYRDPIFKTIIGYGDLVGLVLHGMDFIKHTGSIVGLGAHSHSHTHGSVTTGSSSAFNKLISLIGAGFHIAEIVDHTHGVGEFINGGQKHYHDHDHGKWEDIFGVMHLGHTLFEMAMEPSLPHGIQTVLTFASFGYHHVPHHYYEYSMSDVLRPVISSGLQSSLEASSLN